MTIYCHQNGVLGTWAVAHGKSRFSTDEVQVKSGGMVDVIVDMRDSLNHDSFQLEFTTEEQVAGRTQRINSVGTFSGPTMTPLDAWGRLAQVLLLSNELLFVE